MSPTESEAIPFTCPYCERELFLPPEELVAYTCDYCRKRLDLRAQFAFLRGSEAFQEGQIAYQGLSYRQKKNPSFNTEEQAVIRVLEEAYCSIQQAFATELSDRQRAKGVEMMVNMAQLFLKWNMISSLEANYWQFLMVEHNAQDEYDSLSQRLASPAGGLGFLRRLRWRLRQDQLRRALVNLDQKIRLLEENLELAYPLHARKSHWKPGMG